MDAAAQLLYLILLGVGLVLGALAWTVNLLRWPGALALWASTFTLGEGGFMLLTGIRGCIRLIDGACVEYGSTGWFAGLGVVAIVGGCAGLMALRRRARRRLLFVAAGILSMGAFGFAIGPAFYLAGGPPIILLALAVWRPRLRYA